MDHGLDSLSNSDIKSTLTQQLSTNFELDKNKINEHILNETLEFSLALREEKKAYWNKHNCIMESSSVLNKINFDKYAYIERDRE